MPGEHKVELSEKLLELISVTSQVPFPGNLSKLKDSEVAIQLPNPVYDDETEQTFLLRSNNFIISKRPYASYHDLLFENLNRTLGADWIHAQELLPREDRHFVYKCFNELDAYINSGGIGMRNETPIMKSAKPNGYVQSLLTLAFEIYILELNGVLNKKVFNRLKLKDQYQGARYEITVASIFIRAGWTIEWYDDIPNVKVAEFLATSPDGKVQIIVEAKSKHRDGVIHKNGLFDPTDAKKGKLLRQYLAAQEKETFGLPYIIFLDINAPQDVGTNDQMHWIEDLKQMIDTAEPDRVPDSIDKQNMLISTNFAPHYEGRGVAGSGQSVIMLSTKSEHPIEQSYLMEIWTTVQRIQRVPNLEAIWINTQKDKKRG